MWFLGWSEKRWPPWPLIGWDIFDFSSETAEQNSTKLDRKQDLNVLYQFCVLWADRKKDGRPGLWLAETFSTSPLKPLNRIQRNLRGSKILTSSTKFVFLGRSEEQDAPPGLWLAETFSTSPLKPLNRIQRNLTGSKILMSSTKFVFFFGRSEKQDGCPGFWFAEIFSTSPLKPLNGIQWNLTGSKILRSSTKFVLFLGRSEKQDGRPGLWLAETFSTSPLKPLNRIQRNLTGSKILMSSTNFVFFGRSEKMAALASDWLRHFRLLLWNRWTEFTKTWQEARSQLPLPCLCFLGRSEKQDGGLGLWLAETFSTSPLKPLNRIQRNLTGSKILMSSTNFVFFGLNGKKDGRWPPWPLIGWDIFDFSSETAERNSMKLDRKQDLNFFYHVCVFWADRKNKMAALASDWQETFSTSSLKPLNGIQWNLTGSKILMSSLPSLCFSGRSEKQDGRSGFWLTETFSTSPLKPLNRIQRNLTRSKILMSSTKLVFFLADRKNKMATLASDWLGHFRLLVWNRWTEFNEAWQEARS